MQNMHVDAAIDNDMRNKYSRFTYLLSLLTCVSWYYRRHLNQKDTIETTRRDIKLRV